MMSYPEYTRAERIADGVIHIIGIVASLIAVSFVLMLAIPTLDVSNSTALVIYGVTVVLLFCVSASYHMVTHEGWKPILRRFDQAAIFLKIAGTYTPLVILIGNAFAYAVLAFVWVAAVLGAVAKLALRRKLDGITVGIFLVLGWASLTLAWPIFERLPLSVSVLIVAGGVLYSVGVIFHLWSGLKYQNAIWHGFVLAASSCHFVAVTTGTFSVA